MYTYIYIFLNGTEGIVMLQHFTKIHDITDMIIKLLEFWEGKFLRAREEFWMQQLNTIFPYGLNRVKVIFQYTSFSTLSKITVLKEVLVTLLLLVMKQHCLILLVLFPR